MKPLELKSFHVCWERLAEDGFCDAVGSMEWKRVIQEWVEARCPAEIEDCIRESANRPPATK